jgi:uncharacterized membrane protein
VRVEKHIRVDAAPERVWDFISEPLNYEHFMAGITRWDEFAAPHALAWTAITGIDQRGRWRLRPRADGGTDVTLRLSYHAEGGLLGVITDRVAAPIVGGNLKRSLAELKRMVERQGAVTGAR